MKTILFLLLVLPAWANDWVLSNSSADNITYRFEIYPFGSEDYWIYSVAVPAHHSISIAEPFAVGGIPDETYNQIFGYFLLRIMDSDGGELTSTDSDWTFNQGWSFNGNYITTEGPALEWMIGYNYDTYSIPTVITLPGVGEVTLPQWAVATPEIAVFFLGFCTAAGIALVRAGLRWFKRADGINPTGE